jgi:hypothetical protein
MVRAMELRTLPPVIAWVYFGRQLDLAVHEDPFLLQ